MTIGDLLDLLERVRKSGRGWTACCPAHDDRVPSLSVREGDDGRILVHCFAGCTPAKITAALGLRLADLYPARPDFDYATFSPRTRDERLAEETAGLRRHVRMLELEQRRFSDALHIASILIGIAYSDDPDAVFERLWQGAVERAERAAANAASAHCGEVAHGG